MLNPASPLLSTGFTEASSKAMPPEGSSRLQPMSPMFVSQNISGIPGTPEKLALGSDVKLKMEKLEMVRLRGLVHITKI